MERCSWWPPSRLRGLLLVLLFALAGWWRLATLSTHGYWADEALTVTLTGPRYSAGQVLEYCLGVDRCSFVYNFSLHAWTSLFGTGEFATRLPSALLGLGFSLLVYLLGRRLAGERVGLLALGLSLLSPYWLYLSQEARPYALVGFEAALSTYLLLQARHTVTGGMASRYSGWPCSSPRDAERSKQSEISNLKSQIPGPQSKIQNPKSKIYVGQSKIQNPKSKMVWWCAYSIVTLLSLYTNAFCFFVWAWQLLWLVTGENRRAWRQWLGWQFAIGLLALPDAWALLGSWGQAEFISRGNPYLLQKFMGVVYRLGFGFLFDTGTRAEAPQALSTPVQLTVVILLTGLGLLLLLSGTRSRRWEAESRRLLMLGAALPLILTFLIFPLRLSPRQLSLLSPFWLLLWAAAVVDLLAQPREVFTNIPGLLFMPVVDRRSTVMQRLGYALLALFVAGQLVAVADFYHQRQHPYARTDLRGLTAEIGKKCQPTSKIYLLRSPQPGAMKLRFTLPEEEYEGVVAAFELYAPQLPHPTFLPANQLRRLEHEHANPVLIIWPRAAVTDDPRAELMQLFGPQLETTAFGDRLSLIENRPIP